MSQHFLLSAKARTLSLAKVVRMSDEDAAEAFKQIRWNATAGEPSCPRCGCLGVYSYKSRPLFKCKACEHQFSVTSGTIFAGRKLALRTILLAVAIFVNGAKGHSALQLSRDLDVQYKTAFVLSHKLREAIAAEKADATVSGEVAVDGAYFGGYVKPANYRENRRDRRLAINQTGKRRVVVIAREIAGKTLPFVFKSEPEALETLGQRIEVGSIVHADEATHWDALHSRYLTKRINHERAYSDDGACTNAAESFFSRLRRAEIGTHHHILRNPLISRAA
jgi:transposase-like protein